MRSLSTDNAPAAVGPYAQAVISGGLLFASGQIPLLRQTGATAAGGIREQTEQVIQNLRAVLAAAGTTLDRVIKTTCFLTSMDDFAVFNEVYGRHFTGKPARSCVAVAALPKNALLEIEAIAEV